MKYASESLIEESCFSKLLGDSSVCNYLKFILKYGNETNSYLLLRGKKKKTLKCAFLSEHIKDFSRSDQFPLGSDQKQLAGRCFSVSYITFQWVSLLAASSLA